MGHLTMVVGFGGTDGVIKLRVSENMDVQRGR